MKTKYKTAVMIAFTFFILLGCREKSESQQLLSIAAFDEKLSSTSNKILLDVRTPAEYQEGHLPDATLIDIKRDDFTAQINKLDKGKPVFVYCAAGIRSEKAAAILHAQGFKEVYDLDGGFNAWKDAGKPVSVE